MRTQQQNDRSAFWTAFWEGASAPAMLYTSEPPKIRRIEIPHRTAQSDLDAMRSDWQRIGTDFIHVITRETLATAIKA
jgi:hypothetical protein